MCQVFDDIDRTLAGGARGPISHFDYLNSSCRTEAQAVRAIIHDWLSRYPVTHQPSLVSRLRTHDDVEHLSASFELILHELLLRAGCTMDLPPQGPNVPRRPDFVVTPPSGQSFYLEATADEHDVVAALLGSVCVIVRRGHGSPVVAEESRNPDGAWFGPSGPVNTRVSAVLSTDRLSFWSLGQRRLCLFHNPWAAKPLANWPLETDVFEPAGNELRRSSGSSLAELFGLTDGWPEASC